MAALKLEISSRAEGISDNTISSIYLGGGTPSILTSGDLTALIDLLRASFGVDKDAEICIEANPDDLTTDYLENLREIGFNRISIGIQSFHEEDLQLMRRSHNSFQAEKAVVDAHNAGFTNITMDLIYGTPGLDNKKWKENLDKAFSLPIQHLSAYHLTFEAGTVFDHWRKRGKLIPVSESRSLAQYKLLMEHAGHHGFKHYEISNFAKGESYSKHNMIYWNRNSYLGLGPSSHSYDGIERRWNCNNLKGYISAFETGESCFETEKLSPSEQYHDYVLTSLRTFWGLDKKEMEKTFGPNIMHHFESASKPYIGSGKLLSEGGFVRMTPESWFISDHIMRDLFLPTP